MAGPRFGRCAEAALWILVVLADGPRSTVGLLDGVRRLDGPIGPGTLFEAIVRLEAARLIERSMTVSGPAYRTSRSPLQGG